MSKQHEVLGYLLTVERADLNDIYKNVSFGYYHNYKKHLGVLMARLVKNGRVERIKPGVYKINKSFYQYLEKKSQKFNDPNQTHLF